MSMFLHYELVLLPLPSMHFFVSQFLLMILKNTVESDFISSLTLKQLHSVYISFKYSGEHKITKKVWKLLRKYGYNENLYM